MYLKSFKDLIMYGHLITKKIYNYSFKSREFKIFIIMKKKSKMCTLRKAYIKLHRLKAKVVYICDLIFSTDES